MRAKALLMLLIFFLMCGVASAGAIEEVEQHFQKGLQLSQNGDTEEALKEFDEVVSTDPNSLSHDYYVDTYSEAFFDIGLIYSKKREFEKGAENYRKALKIFPNHRRSLYYLSYNLIKMGEVAEAMQYYRQAKALGFTGDAKGPGDFVGEALRPFKERDLAIEYQPDFQSEESTTIKIRGNPIGDDGLIRDAVRAIERVLLIEGHDEMFSQATVQYIRHKEERTIAVEKWALQGTGWQKDIWVKYDFTPPEGFPYKVLIVASEREPE